MKIKIGVFLLILASFIVVGAAGAEIIPPYSNTVEMGSSFSGSQLSMVTSASETHVASNPFVPASMNYNIEISGIGTASAYIRAHIMEGQTAGLLNKLSALGDGRAGLVLIERYPVFHQSVDLSYSEKTTASGNIQHFSKSMSYQSGSLTF